MGGSWAVLLPKDVNGVHSVLLVILSCCTLKEENLKQCIRWILRRENCLSWQRQLYSHNTPLGSNRLGAQAQLSDTDTHIFLMTHVWTFSLKIARGVETAELVAGLWASQPWWEEAVRSAVFAWCEESGTRLQGSGSFLKMKFGQNLTSWICGEKCQTYLLINELKNSSSPNLPDQTYGLARPNTSYSPRFL